MADFTNAWDLVERLRTLENAEGGGLIADALAEAADLIERQAGRINHLININVGLRETLGDQRAGLSELKAMLAEKSA